MRGLTIKNETAWSTEDLRALVARCLKARGASGPRHVTFAYQRKGTRRLGCADVPRTNADGEILESYMVRVGRRLMETREGYRIRVNLPRPDESSLAEVFYVDVGPDGTAGREGRTEIELKPDDLRKLLITIEHEVDHTMGLRHPDMVQDSTRPCAWFDGSPVRLELKRPPSAEARRAEQIAKHAAAIKRLETRIKRAETAIKSRRRRIAALESAGRRQAARREQ